MMIMGWALGVGVGNKRLMEAREGGRGGGGGGEMAAEVEGCR
jgi:hypothetical protein